MPNSNSNEPFLTGRYTWYLARTLTGLEQEETSILANLRAATAKGMCKSELWPQHVVIPSEPVIRAAEADAYKHRIGLYQRLNSIEKMRLSLANGNLIRVGIHVYESIFTVGIDGVVPMPKPDEVYVGQHAVIVCGYKDDDSSQAESNGQLSGRFTIQNSWGSEWGENGFGYISYEYVRTYGVEVFTQGEIFVPFLTEREVHVYPRITRKFEKVRVWVTWCLENVLTSELLVAFQLEHSKHKLAGWIICAIRDNHWSSFEVVDFFVWPEFRRRGYGSVLLDVAEETARENGIYAISGWISVDDVDPNGHPTHQHFFARRGFTYVRRNDVFRWSRGVLTKFLV